MKHGDETKRDRAAGPRDTRGWSLSGAAKLASVRLTEGCPWLLPKRNSPGRLRMTPGRCDTRGTSEVVPRPLRRRPFPVPVVDSAACTACGACAAICMTGAIQLEDVASIDEQLCVGCAACIPECPEQAIRLP